jgi:kinetochore protein Spc25
MSLHIPHVPQIDLAAIPAVTSTNPEIDFRFQAFETSTRNFLTAVANDKTRTIATIADKRAINVADKKQTPEGVTNVEAETNECKMQEIQLVAGTAAPIGRRRVYSVFVCFRPAKGGGRTEGC